MRVVRRRDMLTFRLYGKNVLSLDLIVSRLQAWSWPILIVASAVAANVVVVNDSQTVIRPVLVLWFLLVCPGMAFVRLLRISSIAIEMALGIALSLALATIISGSILYAGISSISLFLGILGGMSIAGAVAQVFVLSAGSTPESEDK